MFWLSQATRGKSIDRKRTARQQTRRRLTSRTLECESLESRIVLSLSSIEMLDPIDSGVTTAEKSQSKVWQHEDAWWSVLGNDTGTHVFRLDGTAWTPVLQLATETDYLIDVKSIGDLAHVLLVDGDETQLASVEYMAGGLGTYEFWATRPELVDLPFPGSVETATIDVDSTGRMWTAYENSHDIRVHYSDAPYSTWSAPIVLAEDVDNDDIAAVKALPNDTVGVLWSNQTTQRFGFRLHVDGDDPTVWAADEVPASQSAADVGGGMADDHLSMAAASDGTLYAAVKTNFNDASLPEVGLLVRHPDGQWDPLHLVDTRGTRPTVVLNEATDTLLVAYRHRDTSGPIEYKTSSTATIDFGDVQVLLDDTTLNNPTTTKQHSTDGVVILASNGVVAGARLFSEVETNLPPVVDAGLNQAIILGSAANLDGTVSDDGLPDPPSALTTLWSMVSGPGSVIFEDEFAVDTTATFDAAGSYVLELFADDGDQTASDQVTVNVSEPSAQTSISFRNGQFPTPDYYGTEDTKLFVNDQNRNFRNGSIMQADGNPDTAALFKWDISDVAPGSVVTSASITLNIVNRSTQTYELYEVLRPWVERRATWNDFDSGNAWDVPGAQGAGDRGSTAVGDFTATTKGLVTIDLNAEGIALVQQWVNNPESNYGVILQDYANTDGMGFHSSEHSDVGTRPTLSLNFAELTPPPAGFLYGPYVQGIVDPITDELADQRNAIVEELAIIRPNDWPESPISSYSSTLQDRTESLHNRLVDLAYLSDTLLEESSDEDSSNSATTVNFSSSWGFSSRR